VYLRIHKEIILSVKENYPWDMRLPDLVHIHNPRMLSTSEILPWDILVPEIIFFVYQKYNYNQASSVLSDRPIGNLYNLSSKPRLLQE
jgi:hypothetical protein